MSATKSVNGYLIKSAPDGAWWVTSAADESIAGPFALEQQAIDVAMVLQDQPAPAARRRRNT